MKRYKLKRDIRRMWRVVCEKGVFYVEADGRADAARLAKQDAYWQFGNVVRVELVE